MANRLDGAMGISVAPLSLILVGAEAGCTVFKEYLTIRSIRLIKAIMRVSAQNTYLVVDTRMKTNGL